MKKKIVLLYVFVLSGIFILSIIWEFFIESNSVYFTEIFSNEDFEEKIWIVVSSVSNSALALILPSWLLFRSESKLQVAENEKNGEKLSHLRYLESMNRIHSALQHELEFDKALPNLLKAVHSIFKSDRAWLMHPADPESQYLPIAYEVAKPECPVRGKAGEERPMIRETVVETLKNDQPTIRTFKNIEKGSAEKSAVKSQMTISLRPSFGKPWILGLDQCSFDREWRNEEQELFKDISEQITISLNNMLLRRDIETSRENLLLFRNMVDDATDSIFLTDVESGQFVDFNETASRKLGYSREELLSMKASDIELNILDQLEWKEHVDELKKANSLSSTGAHRRKDGATYPVEVNIKYLGEKFPNRMVTIVRDISERKKTDDMLQKLYNAVEQAGEMIVIANSKGVIEYINPATEEITGYSKGELVGSTAKLFESGVHGQESYETIWQTIKSGNVWRGEQISKKKSGELFNQAITIAPIFTGDGEITHFVAVMRDRTGEKVIQEKLIHSEKLSTLGTFVSGIAHDLNNPLTSVIGFSEELMQVDGMPEEALDYLEIIFTQSKRTAGIVKRLLEYSRDYKGEKFSININDLIESTLSLFSNNLRGSKVNIQTNLCSTPIYVEASVGQLQQVFINILSNARQSINRSNLEGSIIIATKCSGDSVDITIENDGPHITKQSMDKLFKPFFSTKGETGHGLGLFISKEIAKDHGGDILAENLEKSGVRFTVTLPIFKEEKLAGGGVALSSSELSGIRVLLIDDEELVIFWMKSFLLKEGVFVHTAANGEEAIQLIKEIEFDAIFSDLKMPIMDGYELSRWLVGAMPEYIGRFVLVTGVIDDEVDSHCKKYGFESIIKPFAKKEFLNSLKRIVHKNSNGKEQVLTIETV